MSTTVFGPLRQHVELVRSVWSSFQYPSQDDIVVWETWPRPTLSAPAGGGVAASMAADRQIQLLLLLLREGAVPCSSSRAAYVNGWPQYSFDSPGSWLFKSDSLSPNNRRCSLGRHSSFYAEACIPSTAPANKSDFCRCFMHHMDTALMNARVSYKRIKVFATGH